MNTKSEYYERILNLSRENDPPYLDEVENLCNQTISEIKIGIENSAKQGRYSYVHQMSIFRSDRETVNILRCITRAFSDLGFSTDFLMVDWTRKIEIKINWG